MAILLKYPGRPIPYILLEGLLPRNLPEESADPEDAEVANLRKLTDPVCQSFFDDEREDERLLEDPMNQIEKHLARVLKAIPKALRPAKRSHFIKLARDAVNLSVVRAKGCGNAGNIDLPQNQAFALISFENVGVGWGRRSRET